MSFYIGNRNAVGSAITEKHCREHLSGKSPVHVVSGGMGMKALSVDTKEDLITALGGLAFKHAEEIKVTYGLTLRHRKSNLEKIQEKLNSFGIEYPSVWTPMHPLEEHALALGAVNPQKHPDGVAPGLPKDIRSFCVCGSSMIGIYKLKNVFMVDHPKIDEETAIQYSLVKKFGEDEDEYIERIQMIANVIALRYKEMLWDSGSIESPAMLLAGSFSHIQWPKSVVDFQYGVPSFARVSIMSLTDHVDTLGERGLAARIIIHKLADLLDEIV